MVLPVNNIHTAERKIVVSEFLKIYLYLSFHFIDLYCRSSAEHNYFM